MTSLNLMSRETVLAVHSRLLEKDGGAPGIRDEAAIDAALARAQQLAAYSDDHIDAIVASVAIAYSFLKIRHPFVDGNKRTGFMVLFLTLYLNGLFLDVSEREATDFVLGVAAGEISESQWIDWVRKHSEAI